MYSVYQHWDPLRVCAVGRSYPPDSTIKDKIPICSDCELLKNSVVTKHIVTAGQYFGNQSTSV